MPTDPFSLPNPFNAANAQLGISPAEAATRQPALPPLSPQDEQSLLERIGSGLGSGLSFVAGMLNKPGRVVRGLIGGKPREALNILPFSDALGITRPEDEVRGQDLIGAQDASLLSPEGAAGLGIDILTDPLTYLSFGGSALTKAGLAAKKAGTLPATVAERAAQGLGGHVGVGMPFAGNAATFNLAPLGSALSSGVSKAASFIPGGNAALEAGGKIGGALSDLYRQTIPPLFQGSVMGRKTKAGQDIARSITEATPKAIAEANLESMPLAQRALEAGLGDAEGSRLLRQAGETGIGLHPMAPGWTPEREAAIQELLNPMQETLRGNLAGRAERGLPAHELAKQPIRQGLGEGQDLGFLPRQATQEEPKTLGQFFQSKTIKPEEQFKRKDWTTGLTTDSLNRIKSEDLGIANSTLNPEQQVQKSIMDKYLGGAKQEAEVARLKDAVLQDQLAHQGIVTNTEVAAQLTKAQATQKALESQAGELAKMKMKGSLPSFDNHVLADYSRKNVMDKLDMMKADKVYEGLAKAAVPAGEDTVPVMDALKSLWKTSETAGESIMDAGGNLVGHTAPMGAQVKMAEALGVSVDKLKDIHLPTDLVKDVAGLSRMRTYDGLQEFTKLWDGITNITKAGQTAWPATIVRNGIQDTYMKVLKSLGDPAYSRIDPRFYKGPIDDWKVIANGGTVPGVAKKAVSLVGAGLSDEQAANKLREMYTAWDVGRDAWKRAATLAGEAPDVGRGVAEKTLEGLLPVSELKNPLSAYTGGLKEGLQLTKENPKAMFNVAGAFGSTQDILPPVRAARAAMNSMDNTMRGSSWLAAGYQGNVPEQAFQRMMEAHYDFSNLSQFERGVMRRAVPFYGWARQNIPSVIKEVAENPGGVMGQSIRAAEEGKGRHPGFVPEWLGQGVAAKVGQEENGTQRFLSQLGLGFEDIGRDMSARGLLGNLNPLLKFPIEQATGQQIFSGRDLRDLNSRLGLEGPATVAENAIMNSPIGRAVSVFGPHGTLMDERKSPLDKAINLLTGARLQDVNMEQAQRNAVRDFVSSQMHGPGISQYTDFSVKPENLPLLTPDQQRLLALHNQLRSRRPLPALP